VDDRDRYLTHSYTESRDRGRKEHERHDLADARQVVADAGRPDLGDRVRITGVMNDPNPLPVGTQGTVNWLGQWVSELTKQIGVK
jgi:hypothetical protein